MRISLSLPFIFISFITRISAQNLILNPGFEEHDTFLVDSTASHYEWSGFGVKNWTVPNESYPWFADTTAENYENVRYLDEITPHSGKAFSGLCLYSPYNARYYLQGEFSQPLKAGKRYKFTIHLALGKYSTYNIDQFGVYFGKTKVSQPVKNEITVSTPQLILNVSGVFAKKSTWVEVSGL